MAEERSESVVISRNSERSDSMNQVVENGYNEEPNFSDPEDYVDDITDEELMPELIRSKPREDTSFESVIVVDRIPQVGPERFEKLKTVLKKHFEKCGTIKNELYPKDEKEVTKGYLFIEYTSPDSALEAIKMYDGYKLDKTHIFQVNLFSDIDKYTNQTEAIVDETPRKYEDYGNLRFWLQDPDCCDQYSVLHNACQTASIYLNTSPEPTLLDERDRWTQQIVTWSPLGTFLASFHDPGIALWAGEKFKQYKKFAHEGVAFIDFSPLENYLVTLTPLVQNDPNAIIIWDIRTGAKKRSFQTDLEHLFWPVFKWSHDDRYFARIQQDILSIYETPSFGLLDKKSLKINGVKNFTWSPTQNILAYWVAEDKNVPARVSLIEIPSRNEIRSKNLFSVADCKMHWQKCGDYLCVKVDRYTKVSKKDKGEVKYSGMYYNFEIFHMREKQIPVDSIEIKEPIVAFNWEPVGSKFGIIHGDGPQYTVSFYGIKTGGAVALLKKFEQKSCNHLFWSPAGQFLVLACLRSSNHTLEFVDTSDFTITSQTEHFMATDVEWDPTGRYVVTGVSWWMHKVDNAYWLWSFQGRLIRKHNVDKFCQLLWRPKPPTLLNEEKIKEIKKNLKNYSAQFDIKDRMALSKVSKELLEKRQKMMTDFQDIKKENEKEFLESKKSRMILRGIDTDDNDLQNIDIDEEVVEFFIKEEIIVIEEDSYLIS